MSCVAGSATVTNTSRLDAHKTVVAKEQEKGVRINFIPVHWIGEYWS